MSDKLQDPNYPFPHEVIHCRNCRELIRVKNEFSTQGVVIRTKKDAKWSYYGGLCCSKKCEEQSVMDLQSSMPGAGICRSVSPDVQRQINSRWDN